MARFASSSTPLAGSATWSDILNVGREDHVVGLIFTDQAGTLHIEQSTNGTNWDLDETIAVVASTGQGFSKVVYAPFVRVRFVNGATPNTIFRISARLSSAGDS